MSDVKLPDEAINQIRQYTDDSDRAQWAIADITIALVDELASAYTKTAIRSRIAVEVGFAPETVRDRERIGRLVSSSLRVTYPLTFHQWRACASCSDKSKIQEYATWAMESGDVFNGRPAPVLAIRAHIHPGGHHTNRWVRVLELLEQIKDDEAEDANIRRFAKWILVIAEEKKLI